MSTSNTPSSFSSLESGQPSLFDSSREQARANAAPLADVLRPVTLEDFVGQMHIIGPGTPLRTLIDSGRLTSVLFWGPPGVGKTTLARLIATRSDAKFITLSAVNSGLQELRQAVAQAEEALAFYGRRVVLFIDEIHRYSKTQQDALLPYVENGTITLIGATTENPSFQVIPALLSRLLLIRLEALSRDDMAQIIQRGVAYANTQGRGLVKLDELAVSFIIDYANGDGRSALTLLEAAIASTSLETQGSGGLHQSITLAVLEQLSQQNRLLYDRQGDEHYDHASAYQKSMRGSDADAAIYWLAKMIAGGEDPRFIARRLMITAAEDVGLADPMAMVIANAVADIVEKVGMPEGRIPLVTATAYVARAPKSNHAYLALGRALQDIQKNGKGFPVPKHLRDSHYSGAKQYGHGQGYVYTHTAPEVTQIFLPDALVGTRYLLDATSNED